MVVCALAIQCVEGRGLGSLVAHGHRRGTVALHFAGIGTQALVAQAQHRGPAGSRVRFPLGKQRVAIALAIADVGEDARAHRAARRWPVIIQAIALPLDTETRQILALQRQIQMQRGAGGAAVGVHRHAGGATARWVTHEANRRARTAAAGIGPVPEAPVRPEVHAVLDLLVIGTYLQRAPVQIAEIAQIHALLPVVDHVHALVRIALEGCVLITELGLDQLIAPAPGQRQRMVVGLIGTRSHLVQRQGVTIAASHRAGLEVAAGAVVVRLCMRSAVTGGKALAGIGQIQIATPGGAIVAIAQARLATPLGLGAGFDKARTARFHHDAAGDAVATSTDRGDAGVDLNPTDRSRIQVGQRRVHVIRA